MLWYEGSIAEAVNLSKERNAIFVVFVEDDQELSSEMHSTLEDKEISQRLSNEANFLIIKLKSGSTDYTHFAQIYQFVPVPSMFFIGRSGTPLEVICAGVDPDNLAARIDRILREHHKQFPPLHLESLAQPSTSTQSMKQQTAALIQEEAKTHPDSALPVIKSEDTLKPDSNEAVPSAETAPVTKKQHPRDEEAETSAGPASNLRRTEDDVEPATQFEVVCTGDVCERRPIAQGEVQSASPAAAEPMETESSLLEEEAKRKRALELIEARRREKAIQEKEKERREELERRQTGQGVAELKRWQQEQELKQIQEERKREKLEEQQARQRVLAQIAQDRAERRATVTAALPVSSVTVTASPGDMASRTRIQFKLASGTSHTAQFDADDQLAVVRQYVADNLQLDNAQFSLWTAFPRRELTEDEATLRRLQLAPSAALLVLPGAHVQRDVTQSGRLDNLSTWLTELFNAYVLMPSMQIWNFIRTRMFPGQRRPRARSEDGRPSPLAPGLRYRPGNNIHRLTGDANDDDNNTWNGNSTQQM